MARELASNYLRELEDIALKRNVLQLKVPSGITLTEHEAQYLTKFSNRMYVCFLSRFLQMVWQERSLGYIAQRGNLSLLQLRVQVTGGRKHQRASLKSVLN